MPSSLRVMRKASGKYFVSLVVEVAPKELPKTDAAVGIDFGIARLATLSDGTRVANPKYSSKYARRMAWMQRQLARKQKGSNRRQRWKMRTAKLHEKIANSRADTIQKMSLDVVKRFDVIYVEDLNLRGMTKNHSLARSLSDASIGAAIRCLEAKAAMYGRRVEKIDRWFPSSKMCSACGCIVESLFDKTGSLSVREWTCACGAIHDRDANAAANILAVGQTVTAHGAGIRAVRDSSRKASLRRSANQQNVRDFA